MSRDIFKDVAGSQPSRAHYGFTAISISEAANGSSSSIMVPRDPEAQRFVDAMNAEREIERARKEVEMNTPENRQRALEAELAERERKKIDFHGRRAIPRCMMQGWKHLWEDLTDEQIRVYTLNNERRRFWGIKPAGIKMFDFWEQIDPEVRRYDDRYALTWVNPLIPPPVTIFDEINPVIWAGQGLNPDTKPPEPSMSTAPPPTKATAKPKRRQKTPDVNPTHRVRKPTRGSPNVNPNTRESLADKFGDPRLEGQTRKAAETAQASDRPLRNEAAFIASGAQQKPATEDFKRPRGRPAGKAKPVAKDKTSSPPKRPRGRPAANAKSTAKDEVELPSKRPRGRPSAKGKQPKKTSAVKGNAKVTKASQTEQRRPSAPSTHKMRTRGEGPAEHLHLR